MSADFKPTLDGYKDLKPFVFWAQTTMPTVFDDSLSYYEVLTKLTKMVNVLLENTDTAEHNIEAIAAVFAQLQNYVNHYFDSLDVSAEVNKRLDLMVEDGTLDAMILPIVEHYTSEVIDDVVHAQLSEVVSEQIGGAVANQIDAAIAPQITPKVNAYLDTNLPPLVEEQVPIAVGEQIDPAVSVLLPAVVDEQLPNAVSTEMTSALPPVVTSQLPGVVATQIPGAVASQMPAILSPIATQQIQTLVPNWLATHISNPSNPPLDDTLGLKNCAAESWYVGRRFLDLQGSPVTMEEDKKVVYQTGEVAEAEHWLTFTATVSDKFPCSVGYPHFDLEQDPVVDWTYAYYDANGDYIANSGNTWEGFINWGVVTEQVPDGAATIKFSIQSDAADFISGDLAVLVFGNGAQIIDAINSINISIALDDTLTQPDKAADAKAAGDAIGAVDDKVDAVDAEVDAVSVKTDYLEDCILNNSIPYAKNGSGSTTYQGYTAYLTQTGNIAVLNGTSGATSGQGGTKIQACGNFVMWNGTTTPDAAKVFPIKLKAGRTYRLQINEISGTRTPDAEIGVGWIEARIYASTSTSQLAACRLDIDQTSAFLDYTPQEDLNVTLRWLWGRRMECTDYTLQFLLKDVTDEVAIDDINNQIFGGNGMVYNYDLSDSTQYAKLIGASSEYITANGYVPPVGWENRVRIDKCCVADYIATNYDVSITDTPTIVIGAVDAGYTSSKHATLARINFLTATVEFLTGAPDTPNIDGKTITAYVYDTIQMTGLSGTEYRIELGRKNRCPYIRVTNLKTSAVCCEKVYTVYETSSSYGGKAGAMYDFPVFGTTEGVCCFKRAFCTVSPDYDVVFIGDSITEGSEVSVSDTWANKVIASDYVRTGLNCGRGGGNIDNVLRCVRDILPAIRPKMVVVTIGTNGGNTQAKMDTLITEIKRLGAVPVINAIPMLRTGYPATNDLILALDTLHCRFDVATAVDNDTSSGQNTALFNGDRIHPNVAGGVALFNCFMTTVGSLIQV